MKGLLQPNLKQQFALRSSERLVKKAGRNPHYEPKLLHTTEKRIELICKGYRKDASSSLRARRRDEEEEEEEEVEKQQQQMLAVAVCRSNEFGLVGGLKVRGFITLLPPAEAWDTLA
ncbi:unnamed protein product [Sphagnum balticum]